MAKQAKLNYGVFLIIVGLLAWAIPGLGHFIIKERKRAIIIFITIVLTFVLGLYVGSLGVVDSVGARAWYMGQLLTSPVIGLIAVVTKSGEYVSYGEPYKIGQIYTTIAGLLNFLCIISAVYMAYSGRGELIGEDEDV